MIKDLRLNLKAKYYIMIESGVKPEEYREIKPYWLTRLTTVSCDKEDICNKLLTINDFDYNIYYKQYDTVTFVYGYTKRQMTFKFDSIKTKEGNPEWGAEPNKKYFVIKFTDRIK